MMNTRLMIALNMNASNLVTNLDTFKVLSLLKGICGASNKTIPEAIGKVYRIY